MTTKPDPQQLLLPLLIVLQGADEPASEEVVAERVLELIKEGQA